MSARISIATSSPVLACTLACVLACARGPTGEPSEPSTAERQAEPVVFVEAVPQPADPPPAASSSDEVSDEQREQAKQLYMVGQERFELGDYAGAAEAFEQAYAFAPLPALLYNIAQCYERLGDAVRACASYEVLGQHPEADPEIRERANQTRAKLGC